MTLSPETTTRIQNMQQALSEVESRTYENTLKMFDGSPESEKHLRVWECIAKIYETFVSEHADLSLDQKKDVYEIALKLVYGMEISDKTYSLTAEQVGKIRELYSDIFIPFINNK